MKRLFLLVLLFSAPAWAAPSPELVKLENKLAAEQEARKNGTVGAEQHELFLKEFRPEFEKTFAALPSSPDNEAARARILVLLGDHKEAAANLEGALKTTPDDPTLRVSLGRTKLDDKDYAGALAEANAVLEMDPDNEAAKFLKAESQGRGAPVRASGSPTGPKGASTAQKPAVDARNTAAQIPVQSRPDAGKTKNTTIPKPGDATPVTALDLDRLVPSYALTQYSPQEREDLARAVNAAGNAASKLYAEHPHVIADATSGWSISGKLSNMTQTLDMVFGGALRYMGLNMAPVQRSCIDHQTAVAGPVKDSLSEDSQLRVVYVHLGGQPWPEHHAVMVFPENTNPVRSGVVFDSWIKQSASPENFVYPYTNWKMQVPIVSMGGERTEEVRRAGP